MQIILAIMLYLHLIVSPATYPKSYIDSLYATHQTEIEAVQSDPVQMGIVNRDYLPQADQIVIVDTDQNQ